MKELSNIIIVTCIIGVVLLVTVVVLALISPNVPKDWYPPLVTEKYND